MVETSLGHKKRKKKVKDSDELVFGQQDDVDDDDDELVFGQQDDNEDELDEIKFKKVPKKAAPKEASPKETSPKKPSHQALGPVLF